MAEEGDTRKRIMEAAADVFAAKGFKAATVRDICSRAEVNVASINYHFGSKKGLYSAVMEYIFRTAFERCPLDMGQDDARTPGERLLAFIRAFFLRLADVSGRGKSPDRLRLLARELVDPSPSLDTVAEKYVTPMRRLLGEIVAEVLGPDADQETVWLCSFSIIGQCQHYFLARQMIQRLGWQFPRDRQGLDRLARHVTGFSLGGIPGASARLPQQQRREGAQ